MNFFNLVTETIAVNQVDFISAVNKQQPFAITIDGDIIPVTAPFTRPRIYQGTPKRHDAVSTKPLPITQILGSTYTLTLDGPKLRIQASLAWQEILQINLPFASYDDSTADGISVFSDEVLEDMGWHATDFDIDYRTMTDHLEKCVEGTVLCVERQEPYQFSGLGFFADEVATRDALYAFLVAAIKEKMANDTDYAPHKLDDDQRTALEFFKISL